MLLALVLYPTTPAQRLAIDTYATEESVDSLSDAINQFAFSLYSQLSRESEDNLFISPYSIFVALAMTYEGAKGQTAQEMYDILGVPQNNETMLCSFGRIYNLLNQKKEYTLNTANALWTQNDYTFLDEYLEFINNYYMGKATDVDFGDAEQAARIINEWVEKNTGGKIKDLISSGDIDPLTKLILTNAIYFKGTWKYQFNPDDTNNADFEITPGSTVSIPMMSLSESDYDFKYYETEEMQMLELPYKGDKLSMIIILPTENDIVSFENSFTYENFLAWKEQCAETSVQIGLPKFTMETEYNLKESFIDMGMTTPFSMDADFSGMNGNQDLFIEKIKHKAYIKVNEEGTEAAAATSVHMTLKSAPGISFYADHPFLYLIHHTETDTILFMGKVMNPS